MAGNSTFAYVVLQYGGFDITRKCLDSIRCVNEDSPIVVVDNCSPDDSLDLLRDYTSDSPAIHILTSDTNSGFSHGNNLGYQYARDTLRSDYIVVLNNDIEIPQHDFEDRVEIIHRESNFAAFGPDIYVPARKTHQNPLNLDGSIWHPDNPSLSDINRLLDYTKGLLNTLDKPGAVRSVVDRAKHSRLLAPVRSGKHAVERKKAADSWASHWTGRFENVPLQGAFYVFAPDFMKTMRLCFYPEPFLYCEEILLQMNCVHRGLKMVYDSSIQVLHNESATTERLFSKEELQKRRRFELENKYKSECLCGLYRVRLDLEEGKPEREAGERRKMIERAEAASVRL